MRRKKRKARTEEEEDVCHSHYRKNGSYIYIHPTAARISPGMQVNSKYITSTKATTSAHLLLYNPNRGDFERELKV